MYIASEKISVYYGATNQKYMNTFAQKLKIIISDAGIRNRILAVLIAIALFRVLANIPIPGVDHAALVQFFANNQYLGLFNVFTGGGLSNLSIVMLGVGPYITASIIMQLMTILSPNVKSMYQEEGEAGRAKFTQISRYLTLPLALMSSFGFLTLLKSQGILSALSQQEFVTNLIIITAGSMLLLWIAELATEFGIGNGMSIIIFAGIVASLPQTISQALLSVSKAQIPLYIGFGILTLVVTYAVVIMTQAERRLPITHAKEVRAGKTYGGTSSYIPLRINQAGVIPIIFALSMLMFPQMLAAVLSNVNAPAVQALASKLVALLADQTVYGGLYFFLVLFFTYFYTAVTFDPESMSKNLQRSGAFIPGIRPGEATITHIGNVVTRLTLVGALFLAVVAVLPIGVQVATGLTSLAIGGTALLIAVSVVIDLVRRIDAQVSMRSY